MAKSTAFSLCCRLKKEEVFAEQPKTSVTYLRHALVNPSSVQRIDSE